MGQKCIASPHTTLEESKALATFPNNVIISNVLILRYRHHISFRISKEIHRHM